MIHTFGDLEKVFLVTTRFSFKLGRNTKFGVRITIILTGNSIESSNQFRN